MNAGEQLDFLTRNAAEVISKPELARKLEKSVSTKTPLRIKAGFDPSAPDIHLGHTVLLTKLREFQDLGHKVVFLIGDFTAMIGDPTGRSQTRPAHGYAEAKANAESYTKQAFKILKNDPQSLETVWNNDWFGKMTLQGFLENVATRHTVARVLERDDFEKRMASDQPISIREFIYPLLQGYDSIHLKADVEMGGTDQKFNLLVGRDLQRSFGQEPQVVLTFPLLIGLDGKNKMSKSLGNHVGVTDEPAEMFGKIMSVSDDGMIEYYRLLTSEDAARIASEIKSGALHPKAAKQELAKKIVTRYWGGALAMQAAAKFDETFSQRKTPSDIPLVRLESGSMTLTKVTIACKLVDSASEAKRLIEQKAVSIDDIVLTDPNAKVSIDQTSKVLKVGKRRFARFSA